MAEGSKVPVLGGYDYEFTSKVPEDWECLVCHLTMKDPVQIVGCGHRLCSICMETLLRRPSSTCPGDRQPLSREKIFPDAACHRKILYLAVKCPHVRCPWTGELRAVEKHESECPFKVVKCPNSCCTEKLTKQDLHDHMALECPWRKINCEYCQESFIMNQKQKHFDICPKIPVECINKCGLKDIPREKLAVHIRDECPATEVQCEYKNLGCESMFPRSNTKSHSETQVEHHLNLALRGLEATQLQVNELVSLVMDQSQQIEKMVSKDKEQAQKIEKLMSQNTEQAQQIERLVSKDKEQAQQIERPEQNAKFFSPFEWRIPNFSSCYNKEILSEPFYLFKCGYRYSLKFTIYSLLNIDLYIRVITGEFDSFLPWPCTQKVRVTLIDQNPCVDKRVNKSSLVDFEKINSGTRPRKEDTNEYHNIRFSTSSYSTSTYSFEKRLLKTQSYIKNDTILIMVNNE